MTSRVVVVMICALAAAPVMAADEDMGWTASAELGYVASRGNTNSETFRLGLKAALKQQQWEHSGSLDVLMTSEDGVDTNDRLELGLQSNRKINDRSYWFGGLRYEDDEFSQFDFQTTLAAGYGRKVLTGEVHYLDIETGLGYPTSEVRQTGVSSDEAIFRGKVDYKWTISETASLENATLVEAGSDNTFGRNVTSLNTSVTSGVGLRLSHEIRHNTDVEETINNSEFLTTVTLVYSFK